MPYLYEIYNKIYCRLYHLIFLLLILIFFFFFAFDLSAMDWGIDFGSLVRSHSKHESFN